MPVHHSHIQSEAADGSLGSQGQQAAAQGPSGQTMWRSTWVTPPYMQRNLQTNLSMSQAFLASLGGHPRRPETSQQAPGDPRGLARLRERQYQTLLQYTLDRGPLQNLWSNPQQSTSPPIPPQPLNNLSEQRMPASLGVLSGAMRTRDLERTGFIRSIGVQPQAVPPAAQNTTPDTGPVRSRAHPPLTPLRDNEFPARPRRFATALTTRYSNPHSGPSRVSPQRGRRVRRSLATLDESAEISGTRRPASEAPQQGVPSPPPSADGGAPSGSGLGAVSLLPSPEPWSSWRYALPISQSPSPNPPAPANQGPTTTSGTPIGDGDDAPVDWVDNCPSLDLLGLDDSMSDMSDFSGLVDEVEGQGDVRMARRAPGVSGWRGSGVTAMRRRGARRGGRRLRLTEQDIVETAVESVRGARQAAVGDAEDTTVYLPPQECSFLQPGQEFEGVQHMKAVGDSPDWLVSVTLHDVCMASGEVRGELRSSNVPNVPQGVVTQFTGEIVDNVHHTFASGDKHHHDWTPCLQAWHHFTSFRPLLREVAGTHGKSSALHSHSHVYMRWKEERFLQGEQDQLSIGGWYYIAVNRLHGTVEGLYYDPQDVKVARRAVVQLMLEPVKGRDGRPMGSWPEASIV